MSYATAVALLLVLRPAALGELLRTPALWSLMLAAGVTNACFNWAVSLGDVVRVILLFYLMPLWTVLLARWFNFKSFEHLKFASAELADVDIGQRFKG